MNMNLYQVAIGRFYLVHCLADSLEEAERMALRMIDSDCGGMSGFDISDFRALQIHFFEDVRMRDVQCITPATIHDGSSVSLIEARKFLSR